MRSGLSGMLSKEALELQKAERELAKARAEKNLQGEIDAAARVQQAQLDFNKETALSENAKQRALELEGEKIQQAEELARRSEFRKKADVAKDATVLARQFRKISEDPSANKILGTFSNNSVFSAIVNLAESGVGVPNFSIGIKDLSPILRNLDLNEKDMRTAQIMGMLIANMQLAKGKMLAGSVSNYEDALMGRAGVNDKDTALTLRAKADMLERQAQYHEDLDSALDDWKGAISAFNKSKKFKDIRDKYVEDITGMASGDLRMSSPAKAAEAKPAPAKAAASSGKKQTDKKIDNADALKKLLEGK